MKASIVIPYRDRLSHLDILIPKLRVVLPDAEIIVVEQDDNNKFRKACLLNTGFKRATHDIIIFHDVDYVPLSDTVYYQEGLDVFLPVKFAEFVYEDFQPKPFEEIPSGYRHFINGVDDTFFGGVLTFTRDAFKKVNGSNTLFIGWGMEDDDLRNRVAHYHLNCQRSTDGYFLVLDHPDSAPSFTDQDFINNIHRSQQSTTHLKFGLDTTFGTVSEVYPEVDGVDKWIVARDFDGPTNIVVSAFNFDEGIE